MIQVSVSGLKELDNVLVELGAKSGTRVLRKAMIRALDPVSQKAKADVPVRSGALRQAITRRFLAGSSRRATQESEVPAMGGRFRAQLYPAIKAKRAITKYQQFYGRLPKRGGIRHGHLIEFGFRTRNKRQIPGRHIFENALSSNSGAVIARFAELMRIGIDEEILRKFAKR